MEVTCTHCRNRIEKESAIRNPLGEHFCSNRCKLMWTDAVHRQEDESGLPGF